MKFYNIRVVRMELRPGVGYIEWQAILQPYTMKLLHIKYMGVSSPEIIH